MASNATNRREQLRRQQDAAARQSRITRIVGVVAGILALVLVGVFVYVFVSQSTANAPSAAQITPPNANADKNGIVIGKGAPGSPTVTMYVDYQCPHCRQFEQDYGQMLDQEAQAGTWTLQNKTMIFMDQNLQNTASSRAAMGAACAATVDRYKDYNLAVFDNQDLKETSRSVGYSDELLRKTIPAKLGITGEQLAKFQSCYDGKATRDFVTAVDKSAYADNVTNTPSLAVNGKKLDLGKVTDPSPNGLKAFILANA